MKRLIVSFIAMSAMLIVTVALALNPVNTVVSPQGLYRTAQLETHIL